MARGKRTTPDIAKAVHVMRGRNDSWADIGRVFSKTHTWARKIFCGFDGTTGLPKQQRRLGGLKKTDAIADDCAVRLAQVMRRGTAKQISARLRTSGLASVSSRTITRRLRMAGVRQVRPVRDVMTPKHRADRVSWCEDRQREMILNPGLFHLWLFSDEARFSLEDCGNSKVSCFFQFMGG